MFRHRAAVPEVRTGLQPQLLGAGGCSKMACIGAWITNGSPRRMGPGAESGKLCLRSGVWGEAGLSSDARPRSPVAVSSGQTGFQAGPGDEQDHRAWKRTLPCRPCSTHPRWPRYHSQSLCSQGAVYGSRKLEAQRWTGLSCPWLRVWSSEAEGVSPDSKEGKGSFL